MTASTNSPGRVMSIFRWVALAPAAIVGAVLVRAAIFYVNRFTLAVAIPSFIADYVGPDSLLGGGFVVVFSDGALGAAIVYFASKLAPAHKRPVILVFATLAVVLGLARAVSLMAGRDFWGALTYFCIAAGALGCATALLRGEHATARPGAVAA